MNIVNNLYWKFNLSCITVWAKTIPHDKLRWVERLARWTFFFLIDEASRTKCQYLLVTCINLNVTQAPGPVSTAIKKRGRDSEKHASDASYSDDDIADEYIEHYSDTEEEQGEATAEQKDDQPWTVRV